jgi:hypothetical protein
MLAKGRAAMLLLGSVGGRDHETGHSPQGAADDVLRGGPA